MINRLLFKELSILRLVDSQALFRLMIVASVIFLSTFLATRPSINYLVIIIGIVAVLILMRLPQLGLVGLVGSIVIPYSISTGSQTPFNTTLLIIPLLLGVWLAEMLRRRKIQLVQTPVAVPMLALVVSTTLSLIAGNMPWNLFANSAPITAQMGGWAVFAFSVGTFFLVGTLVNDRRWLQILTVFFLLISGVYMVGRLGVPPFTSLSATMTNMRSDGSMFWVWTIALASGQLLFNRKLKPIVRILLALLIAVTFYVGIFRARDWASGWFPPLITFGVLVWLRSWRLGLVIGIISVSVIFISNPGFINSLISADTYSIETRDVAKQVLLAQVFPSSPILGLGPANYYYYTPLFSILGYYVRFNSHNNYMDILLQTGILGLVCFVWVMSTVGLLAWRLRKRFGGDFAQGYVYACLGGLVGTLVAAWLGDWLLPFVYNIGLNGFRSSVLAWLFLGGLVALDKISTENKSEISAPDSNSMTKNVA